MPLCPLPWILFCLLSLFCLTSNVAAFESDDFFLSGIGPRWERVDPLGDGKFETVGAGTADARLLISVPAGREHDVWADGLNAPRLRQPCGTEDFTLEVKFDSAVRDRYQTQGILAEGPQGALRFEFLGDGAGTRLFAAEVRPGAAVTKVNKGITGGAPLYMRVARAGSRWTQSYSRDGRTWSAGASFTTTLTLTTIGVYGGNAGTNAPAFTSAIDYVFDLAAPLVPEDGGAGPDLAPPLISQVKATPRPDSALIGWSTDEPAAGEVEYARAGGSSLGTVAAPGPALAQGVELLGLQADTEYQFRIRAWDAAGNPAVSEGHRFRTAARAACGINLWYGPTQLFGWPGIAQKWVNIVGDVAECADLASLSYRLNGGPERSLSVGPDGRRLAAAGDFNADISHADLRAGSNVVEVIARNSSGEETTATVKVEWRNQSWPLPYQVDWQTVQKVQDAVQVVDGKWQITSGRLRPTVLAYDRVVAIGDIRWRDYEVTVPITVAAVDPAGFNVISSSPGIGVQLRWNGHTGSNGSYKKQPLFGWLPVGASAWYGFGSKRFKLVLNGRLAAEDSSGRQIQVGSTWVFKLRVETLAGGEPEYRFKFWPAGQTEPAGWDLRGTGYTTDPTAGSLLLVAHHVDARFGNVTVVPVGEGGTPVAMTDVRLTPGENRATVGWSTNQPATARVTWGRTTARSDGSIDVTARATSQTVELTSLLPGTLYYLRITATDASGSSTSADRTFTTLTGSGGLVGDEFTALDGTRWTFLDPRGDASVSVAGGRAAIAVPAGVEHDLWTSGIFAPRLVQKTANGDFEIAVKFDSAVREKYQMQGIVVEGGEGFLRFEFHGDGGGARFFAAAIAGGSASVKQNRSIGGGAPIYLRLRRTGDSWAPFWSADGSNWTAGTSFTHRLSVTTVGVYGGNAGANPGHTALIDWLRRL